MNNGMEDDFDDAPFCFWFHQRILVAKGLLFFILIMHPFAFASIREF